MRILLTIFCIGLGVAGVALAMSAQHYEVALWSAAFAISQWHILILLKY